MVTTFSTVFSLEQMITLKQGNWCKLKKILLDSTEKVCGRTKGPAQWKSTCWWDGKVENVIKEKRRLWKEWKNGSCSKERYIEAKQVAQRQVYEVKSKAETAVW